VDLRNWQNVNGLKKIGRVGVFGLCDPRLNSCAPTDIEFYRVSSDPEITFPLPKGRKIAARAWLLDPLGHPNDFYYSKTASAEIMSLMTTFAPHLVLLEGLWMHRYIELCQSQSCKIIVDFHDVFFPVTQQLASLSTANDLPGKLLRNILPERVKLIEQRASRAIDQLWVPSDHEAGLMKTLYNPGVPIHVVPNAVDVGFYSINGSNPNKLSPGPKTILFPAMFASQPNSLAAMFLIEDVFPRLASQALDVRIVLAGSQPTTQMLETAKIEPRIVVTGTVADMRPYLHAASAVVVPLFYGSGTRLKILEAFAAGVPVISTAKGAEGLDVKDGKHLLVAETAAEFVAALQRLWKEPPLAQSLIVNGFKLVQNKYSWESAHDTIRSAVEELHIPDS
jgi:glycosyltransferase involved in cell wall biosynthesis